MFLHRLSKPPLPSSNFPSSSSNTFLDLCWQFKPARDLFLKNPLRIILRRRRPQTRHILPSVTRYRILVLIRIVQVHKLMQHPHISSRFVCFLHDYLSRLLHECVGGCGGPEGAEEKYCKHRFSALGTTYGILGFANRAWIWYLPTPLQSAGVVPSELPPFTGPSFVTSVGNGSKARLQSKPPGTCE